MHHFCFIEELATCKYGCNVGKYKVFSFDLRMSVAL